MSKVTFDENGEAVDFLAERNEEIIEALRYAFDVLMDEKNGDKKGNKKLGNRMMQQINNVLNEQPPMSAQQFVNLDADDIYHYWKSFYSFICHYTLYFEIIPNRQDFLLYAGLNSRQYEQLRQSEDDEIKNAIIFIEDRLKREGFAGAEIGNADGKASGFRMTAKGDGHSVVSAGEEMLTQAVEKKNETELWRDLSRLTGNDYGKKFLKG